MEKTKTRNNIGKLPTTSLMEIGLDVLELSSTRVSETTRGANCKLADQFKYMDISNMMTTNVLRGGEVNPTPCCAQIDLYCISELLGAP